MNKKLIIGICSTLLILIMVFSYIFVSKDIAASNKTDTEANGNDNPTQNAEDIIWEEEDTTANQNTTTDQNTSENTNQTSGQNTVKYPYLIKVNRLLNCVTVYGLDESNEYTVPVKAMVCSTGTDTPIGTYKTSDKYTWRRLVGNVWGQYAYRITGSILFHSVPYFTQNKADLESLEFNKLGTKASLGCVRLQVVDAKWLIENCPKGTTVVIYDDGSSPGPLGKPIAKTIPETMTWDPTDPDPSNPWLTNIAISGVKDLIIEVGSSNVNLLENIKAYDGAGSDITQSITVSGSVNQNVIGNYTISYSCIDAFGNTASAQALISVKDTKAPVIKVPTTNFISVNANAVANIESYLLNAIEVTDYSLKNISVSPTSTGVGFTDFIAGNEYEVNITAIDQANNQSAKKVMIKYSAPQITWNKSDNYISSITQEVLKSYVNTIYNNDLTGNLTVNCENLGNNNYKLTYTAVDSFNNTFILVKQVILN